MFPVGNPDMGQAWSTVVVELKRDAELADDWAVVEAFNMLNQLDLIAIKRGANDLAYGHTTAHGSSSSASSTRRPPRWLPKRLMKRKSAPSDID